MKETKVVDFKAFKQNKQNKENAPNYLEDIDVQSIKKEFRSKLRKEKRKEMLKNK